MSARRLKGTLRAVPRKKRESQKEPSYDEVLADLSRLVEAARHASARSVNVLMTATYWAIGRRLVEQEQRGAARAGYGEELVLQLSRDLSSRFGRGFGRANLFQMRAFFLAYRDSLPASATGPGDGPSQTIVQTPSGHLASVRKPEARSFYEAEALRG